MEDCIFCKIIANEIPSKKVFEDDFILAFHDISPLAPVHIIIIPKVCGDLHIDSADDISGENAKYIAKIFEAVPKIAQSCGLSRDTGYRIVTNIGENGGQTVNHLHFHLLGGKSMKMLAFD